MFFTYFFILVPSTITTLEETFSFNISLHFLFYSIAIISLIRPKCDSLEAICRWVYTEIANGHLNLLPDMMRAFFGNFLNIITILIN